MEEAPSSSSSSSLSSSSSQSWMSFTKDKYLFAATKASFFMVVLFICTFLATRWSSLPSLGVTTQIQNALPKSQDTIPTDIQNAPPKSRDTIPTEIQNAPPKPPDTIPTEIQNAPPKPPDTIPTKTEYPIQCVTGINQTQTCPTDYPTTFEVTDPSTRTCPDYFKWIHEDLRPWKEKGITREMVEAARPQAYFRLVVVDGKVYWEKFHGVYQTRDVFTIWGVLQLLRLYPGRLPDLDIMFEAGDVPVIDKTKYAGPEQANAPPMFHFCGDEYTLDIAFPDWSYWGWPEINIKGWNEFKKDLAEGNKKVPWMNRSTFAFWKGNLFMGDRMKLRECNSIEKWNAQIVKQDWDRETKHGFKSSNLADQCTHRYKLYIEGVAWSVSEKYVLACDSMTLLVTPRWYEFFTRSLEPLKHYWPINPDRTNLCKSIKYAVDWGNNHIEKAQEIGKAGSEFVQGELEMENVYDYMFHLLNEYGKLLKYKPTVPPGASQTCSEIMACSEQGLQRQFRLDSMVMAPSKRNPCILPPPQDLQVIQEFLDKQDRVRRKVDHWVAMGDLDPQDTPT